MVKNNIAYHSIRMNLDNEQHHRVHKVIADLNTDVHKSVNQFFIDAADSYISRLEKGELTNEVARKSEESLYVTKNDLEEIRRQIISEIKDEIIVRLGVALSEGQLRKIPLERIIKEMPVQPEDTEADATMAGLVGNWG